MLHKKLANLAISTTSAIMFFCVMWLQPYLQNISPYFLVAGTVAGALATAGTYQTLCSALLWLFKKIQPLRKFLLGDEFIEGTWVGHYVVGSEHRITIEFIEQKTGETIIRGREFTSAGKTRAKWHSETVTIDLNKRQLVYAYSCNVFGQKHVQEGLGVFAMVHEEPGKSANKLDGYSVDITDGDRDPNTEYKIANSETTDEFALNEAKRIFRIPPIDIIV